MSCVLDSNDCLKLTIKGGKEIFVESTKEFITIQDTNITLEHSLVSISKWESKWHKPFIGNEKTNEELLSYIQCMIMEDVNPIIFTCLSEENVKDIKEFIDNPMTATTFKEIEGSSKGSRGGNFITSEILYYSMVALQIPFECQHWHLNRLTTLIRVCNEKNSPDKKMSKNSILKSNNALNAARRKALGSKG